MKRSALGVAPVRRHAFGAGLEPADPLPQRKQAHVLHLVDKTPVVGIGSARDRHDVLLDPGRKLSRSARPRATLLKASVTIRNPVSAPSTILAGQRGPDKENGKGSRSKLPPNTLN